jgi:hypothetical protein
MKKLSAYLLLLSLLVISVSACGSKDDPTSTPADSYLELQLRADAENGRVILDWQMLQSATSYNIYYIEDTGSTPTSAEMKAATPINRSSATYTVTGLTNEKKYWFAISLVNSSGESDLSSPIYAVPTDPAPPTAPENVRANAGNTSVTVTWTHVTDADHYILACWWLDTSTTTGLIAGVGTRTIPGGSSSSAVVGEMTWTDGSSETPGETTYVLKNNRTYYFKVTAVNGSAQSSSSFVASATPKAIPPPFAPVVTAVTAGNASITITWNAVVASPAVTSYNIYIARAKGVTKSTGEVTSFTPITSAPYSSIATDNIHNGTKYYIVVTAVSDNGTSSDTSDDLESAESTEWWAIPVLSGTGTSGEVE